MNDMQIIFKCVPVWLIDIMTYLGLLVRDDQDIRWRVPVYLIEPVETPRAPGPTNTYNY